MVSRLGLFSDDFRNRLAWFCGYHGGWTTRRFLPDAGSTRLWLQTYVMARIRYLS